MTARGFTLIEVMIAIAVLALIGTLTYRAFEGANDLKTRVESAEERDAELRGALGRIAKEVSMTFLSEHFDRKRFRERPTFFRLKRGRGEADLFFTSFAHQRLQTDAKESDQAVFEYTLEHDPDSGGQSLFRREKPRIDDEPDRGGQKQVLARDVLRFTVEAWDPKSRDWRDDWNSTQPPSTAIPLPPRVRVALTVKDETGHERTWTTQAAIPLSQPLDF